MLKTGYNYFRFQDANFGYDNMTILKLSTPLSITPHAHWHLVAYLLFLFRGIHKMVIIFVVDYIIISLKHESTSHVENVLPQMETRLE